MKDTAEFWPPVSIVTHGVKDKHIILLTADEYVVSRMGNKMLKSMYLPYFHRNMFILTFPGSDRVVYKEKLKMNLKKDFKMTPRLNCTKVVSFLFCSYIISSTCVLLHTHFFF